MAIKIQGTTVIDDNREATLADVEIPSDGNFAVLSPPKFQGENSGYTSGGSPNTNTIDKFPFAADANAVDVGDLTQVRGYAAGQQY